MKRITVACITLALTACGHAKDVGTTTTTAAPVPEKVAPPVWSPSPEPDSSQMPFDLPKHLIREPREVDRVHDAQVAAALYNAIVSDPNLTDTAKEVDVTTVDGIVTLRGRVQTAQDKIELDRLARSTAGVRRVENRVQVVP
jgi:hypothetical protein